MEDAHHMQCMEVWGGNQLADSGVVMAGLDAWVFSKPYGHSDSGGDVYYVSSCATGRIVRLLVADVSGHGQSVSETAGKLRALMRRHVNQIDQTRFVGSMNEQFSLLAKAGSFATAVVTTFFAPTNYLSLCNAGHPPPLIYRAAKKQWSFLENKPGADSFGNIPLGVIDLANYDQFDVKLRVGDLVMCYTDSLIEARTTSDEMLGSAGLLELVRTLDVSDPARLTSQLISAVEKRCGKEVTDDDITVLLFRPNGLAPSVPLKDKLLGPFRVLCSAFRSLRTGDAMPWPEMTMENLGGAMIGPFNRLWGKKRQKRGVVIDP